MVDATRGRFWELKELPKDSLIQFENSMSNVKAPNINHLSELWNCSRRSCFIVMTFIKQFLAICGRAPRVILGFSH